MSEEIAAADLATVEQLRARVLELTAHVERAETAQKAWTEIGAKAEADAAALRDLLDQAITLLLIPEKNQGSGWHESREAIIVAFHEQHPGAALLEQHELQLGAAHAEIARLEEALRQVTKMKTIKGARRIVADALEGEIALTKAREE